MLIFTYNTSVARLNRNAMRKVYLPVVVFCLSVLTLQAQDLPEQASAASPKERSITLTEGMSDQLSLDEEQQSEVNQTWTEFFAGMQKLEQSAPMSRSAHHKALLKLEQSRDLKMKGILDEPQYAQYEDFLKANLPSGKDWLKENM